MIDNERTGKKLVSIGLPTYAGEKHIRAALDSLLAQTYRAIEIIISMGLDAAHPDTKLLFAFRLHMSLTKILFTKIL